MTRTSLRWLGGLIVAGSAAVGAFALPVGSHDSALLLSLEPGGSTAQVTGTPGTALIEVCEIQ